MTDFIVLGIILYTINNLPDGVLNARQRNNEMVMVKCSEHRNSNRSCENILPGEKLLREAGAASISQHRGHWTAYRDSHRDAQGRFAEVLPKEKR